MGNKNSADTDGFDDAEKKEQPLLRRINNQMVQNVRLIWLDDDNDDDDDDIDSHNIISQFRRVVNTINTFTNGEECIKFVNNMNDEKICIIISGSFGQCIVPRIHNMSQIDSIFIFCDNKKRQERWTKKWPKVSGVFTEISSICKTLKQAVQICEQNAISISIIDTRNNTYKQNLDQLHPSFMYSKTLKEILLSIKFERRHITEFIDYCRDALAENDDELKNIQKFERKYRDETPIWWYTCGCFLYPMLNRALRLMDVDVIIKMGFFIRDLHHQIEILHWNQFSAQNSDSTLTVYHAQGISKESFEQMKKTKGGLISFNNFLSTRINRDHALDFARRSMPNLDMVAILFVMKIDPTKPTVPFAFIDDVSCSENSDEVLFSMHAVFRIYEIKSMDENDRLYEVKLTLTSDYDKDIHTLTNYIDEETHPDTEGWYRLGLLLLKMGQFDKAQQVYESMLGQTTDKNDAGHIYHLLGWSKYNQGEHKQAIIFYEKALKIYKQTLSPTNARLDDCYNNIGLVYNEMGDYSKALAYYEKSLEIKRQAVPRNRSDVACLYDKIGSLYSGMGNYSKALSSYEKAFKIFQKILHPNHPDLAHYCNNIGLVYYNIGEYEKALSYHYKVLKIRQESFPANDPELAKSYIALGMVYDQMKEYSKAISFYKKALDIQQQSLPPNHPDLAMSYSNFGLVYSNIGKYQKALEFHKKSLEIQRQNLSSDHPDLAVSYGHIGNIYCSMGQHSKALQFCEAAVNIVQHLLPPDHPNLQWYMNTLDRVKEKL